MIEKDGTQAGPIMQRFENLVANWRNSTRHSSKLSSIVLDPSYQQIIGLGFPVVPLLLRELEKGPDHWYWALRAITQQDPARDVPQEDIRQISEAWVSWGRSRGILK